MRILNLPVEVFVLILKLLESRDLLRCAIVCSKWRDLALDVKWRELVVNWFDILEVLGPLEICEWDEFRQQCCWATKHPSIEDAIASEGWRRLNELRKKITRICIGSHLVPDDMDYLLSLKHAVESPHLAFFPKLRELEVLFDDQPQPYGYDLLTGGSLRQFKLDRRINLMMEDDFGGVFEATLSNLALRSPLVEHISVLNSDSPFIDYGKFSNLRTLEHIGTFTVASWMEICARCTLLEDFSISWIKDDLVGEDTITATGPQIQELPVLRVLSISSMYEPDGVVSSHILRTTNMPQLRELKMDLYKLGSVEADGLMSLLSRRCPLLTMLQVISPRLEWGRLALFSGLRDLELQGELSSWTTEHLESIIGGLPNLRQLSIRGLYGGVDRSKPAFTPTILEAIAKTCQLRRLQIPLNALEIPWMQEPPAPTAKFAGLMHLSLGPLHIEADAVEPFAKYLAQLCPTINSFEPIPIHPQEAGSEHWNSNRFPFFLTDEEETRKKMMQTLYFNAQRVVLEESCYVR